MAASNKFAVQMTAEQAMTALEAKLMSRYASLRTLFLQVHPGRGGESSLSRAEFRAFLQHSGIELDANEFRKLWCKFDTSADGKLSYAEVQAHFGRIISPAAEGLKFSRPVTPPMSANKQASVAKAMKKKIHDVESTFRAFDMDGSGLISLPEFIQAMRKLGVKSLADDESYAVMLRFRDPSNDTGDMTLPEFKKCVSFFMGIPEVIAGARDDVSDAMRDLAHALTEVLGSGQAGGAGLVSACAAYDPRDMGEISYDDAKAVVEGLGVSFTAHALKGLVKLYDPDDVGILLYKEWAVAFSGGEYEPAIAAGTETENFTTIPALHKAGLRPFLNPMTQEPYSMAELVQKVAPRSGMSDHEVRMCFQLVGRKDEVVAAMESIDFKKDGFVRMNDLRAALDGLGVDATDMLLDQIMHRFPTNEEGRVSWHDFTRRLSTFIVVSEYMMKKLMLDRDPGYPARVEKEKAQLAALAAKKSKPAAPGSFAPYNPAASASFNAPDLSLGSMSLAGRGMGDPAHRGGEGAGSPARRGPAFNAHDDDAGTVVTAALDLTPTLSRMRKVLGAGWSSVMADAVKGKDSHVVSGDALRDILARKGVALTSKEVRALSLRFSSPEHVTGAVDVAALMHDTFNGGNASPAKRVAVKAAASPRPRAAVSPLANSGVLALNPGQTRGIF